ncbi:MAG: hypothetical protein INR62_10510, partial [Rhodospirillales bacterium]|nr:hypothetical protein [Acetobacter sp.]
YIAGDDDRHREGDRDAQGRPKVNVGRVKAEEAAAAIGSEAVFPPFPLGTVGTDWNDLAKVQGQPYTASRLREGIAIADREMAARGLAAVPDNAELDQDRSQPKAPGQTLSERGSAFSRSRDRTPVKEVGLER